jgi:hypothetical protein
MTVENPTADSGASITDRIESLLTGQNPAPEVPPKEPDPVPESAPEAAEEQPASDEQPSSDEPQLSLSDLAKYLGVEEESLDVDDDGSLKVKTKIDGKEGAAKFKDLVKSYQLQGHVDAKAREAAEQAKSLQERVSQFEAYAQSEAQKLAHLASIANQELMRELGEIDWQGLARNDPAEYVAKQAEYQVRQGRINQLNEAAQQQAEQARQAQEQRTRQMLAAEAARLPTLIPEWADEKVAATEKAELSKWLISQGVSEKEVNSLARADVVSMLRKAWLFDQGKGKAAVVEKQLRIAPKLVKPGQSKDSGERAAETVRTLKDNIRKSGGKNGIAEYLLATGKV